MDLSLIYFFSTIITYLYLQWVKMGCVQLWFLDLGFSLSCPGLGGAEPNQLQCHWEPGQCPATHTSNFVTFTYCIYFIFCSYSCIDSVQTRMKPPRKVWLTEKNLLKSWAMLENAARWLSSCGSQQHSRRSLLSHTLTARERAVEKNWELLLLSGTSTPSGSMAGGWGRESPSGSNTNTTPNPVISRMIQLWGQKRKILKQDYSLDIKTMNLWTTWQSLLKWQHLRWQDCSLGYHQTPTELPDRPTPVQGCREELAGTLRQGWSDGGLGLWWYL